ncbi:unnamed protein product, partial [Didymodactylos carnosus]
MDELCSRS